MQCAHNFVLALTAAPALRLPPYCALNVVMDTCGQLCTFPLSYAADVEGVISAEIRPKVCAVLGLDVLMRTRIWIFAGSFAHARHRCHRCLLLVVQVAYDGR